MSFSCRLRIKPASPSYSSWPSAKKSGNSRAKDGSSGASLCPMGMSISSASSSLGADCARCMMASLTVEVRFPSTSRSIGSRTVWNFAPRKSAFSFLQGCIYLLTCLLHCCPKPCYLQLFHVGFDFVTLARGYGGFAFRMHLHHQFIGAFFVIAQNRLENIRHIAHEVDRIIPDDAHPRQVFFRSYRDVNCLI